MTSTTMYKTENGKTLKVEPESEKKGSAEKTADNKKQKVNGSLEEFFGDNKTEEK